MERGILRWDYIQHQAFESQWDSVAKPRVARIALPRVNALFPHP